MDDPVVQVVDERSGEIVYTLRIKGREFRPKVFHQGAYTLRVGEPPDRMKEIRAVEALDPDQAAELVVKVP
jgi:hypothetical protein